MDSDSWNRQDSKIKMRGCLFLFLSYASDPFTLSSSQILSPWLGWYSWPYRPARLHWLTGRYGNPMPESTMSPGAVRDKKFGLRKTVNRKMWIKVVVATAGGRSELVSGCGQLLHTPGLGWNLLHLWGLHGASQVHQKVEKLFIEFFNNHFKNYSFLREALGNGRSQVAAVGSIQVTNNWSLLAVLKEKYHKIFESFIFAFCHSSAPKSENRFLTTLVGWRLLFHHCDYSHILDFFLIKQLFFIIVPLYYSQRI